VLAPGVEETAPEASLELDPESPELEPASLEPDPESPEDEPSSQPSDDESYGSLSVLCELCVDVELEVVDPVVAFFTFASAGSSPSWTRSASTPKIATKLATAPAAKRRALGTRRRDGRGGVVGSPGMPSGSTPDLKSS
jgi:hypothetical protein